MSIDDSHTTCAASNTRSTFFIREVLPYCYNKTHGTKNCVMDMTSQLDFNFRMQSVKFRDFQNLQKKNYEVFLKTVFRFEISAIISIKTSKNLEIENFVSLEL